MKYIILILISMLFISCGSSNNNQGNELDTNITTPISPKVEGKTPPSIPKI